MKKQKKYNIKIQYCGDDNEWISLLLALVVFSIGVGTTIWVVLEAVHKADYSLFTLCLITLVPLILGSAGIYRCICDCFTIVREKILTPEEQAAKEAQEKALQEERIAEQEQREQLDAATPHEYILLLYPTEADLPKACTYQELEQEVIRADIAYDSYWVSNQSKSTFRHFRLMQFMIWKCRIRQSM